MGEGVLLLVLVLDLEACPRFAVKELGSGGAEGPS